MIDSLIYLKVFVAEFDSKMKETEQESATANKGGIFMQSTHVEPEMSLFDVSATKESAEKQYKKEVDNMASLVVTEQQETRQYLINDASSVISHEEDMEEKKTQEMTPSAMLAMASKQRQTNFEQLSDQVSQSSDNSYKVIRERSDHEHSQEGLREPSVQLVNDSEFSSPPRRKLAMQQNEERTVSSATASFAQPGAPKFGLTLNKSIIVPNTQQDLSESGKARMSIQADADSGIINIASPTNANQQNVELDDETPCTKVDRRIEVQQKEPMVIEMSKETKKASSKTHKRNFARSVVEQSKPPRISSFVGQQLPMPLVEDESEHSSSIHQQKQANMRQDGQRRASAVVNKSKPDKQRPMVKSGSTSNVQRRGVSGTNKQGTPLPNTARERPRWNQSKSIISNGSKTSLRKNSAAVTKEQQPQQPPSAQATSRRHRDSENQSKKPKQLSIQTRDVTKGQSAEKNREQSPSAADKSILSISQVETSLRLPAEQIEESRDTPLKEAKDEKLLPQNVICLSTRKNQEGFGRPETPQTTLINFDEKSQMTCSERGEIDAGGQLTLNKKENLLNSTIAIDAGYGDSFTTNMQALLESVGPIPVGSETSNSNNIKVVIRVRPFNQREEESELVVKSCVEIEDNRTIILRDKAGESLKSFVFDFIGDPSINQKTIFDQIAKPIADTCLQGYNGTIFAYGQTGAGKTFTIQGPSLQVEPSFVSVDQERDSRVESSQDESRGIMQRSFEYIFECMQEEKQLIQNRGNGSALEYLVKCSFLEIYNEQILDLLDPSQVNLQIREDINRGVFVEGLHEEIVTSQYDMLALILKGTKNRHVGGTSMNRASSRSHSVLTTVIESKSRSATGVWNVKQSRFHIIDLAGSERQKIANTVGDRLKEAGMINKSLSALGNVINSLVDLAEGKSRFVPYRDSKLTFILRDSLGGNSKTAIIANVSPSVLNVNETLSTLKFAQRAKLIRNKAVINEDSSGTLVLLKNEIKKLKRELTDFVRQCGQLENEKQLLSQSLATLAEEQRDQQEADKRNFVPAEGHRLCQICLRELDAIADEGPATTNCAGSDELAELTVNELMYSSQKDTSESVGARMSDQLQKSGPQQLQMMHQRVSSLSGQDPQLALKLVKSHGGSFDINERPSVLRYSITSNQSKLADRVRQLEKILSSRILQAPAAEMAALKAENKKLQEASRLQAQQIASLEAVIDAKEKAILELEASSGTDMVSDSVLQYRHEVTYLKEIIRKQIDSEESPQMLRVHSMLEKERAAHQRELGKLPKHIEELAEELQNYVSFKKNHTMQQIMALEQDLSLKADELSKLALESEQREKSLQEQLDELSGQLECKVDQIMEIETAAERQMREFARLKVELQGERTARVQERQEQDETKMKAEQTETSLRRAISDLEKKTEDLKNEHKLQLQQLNQQLAAERRQYDEHQETLKDKISSQQNAMQAEVKARKDVEAELVKTREQHTQLRSQHQNLGKQLEVSVKSNNDLKSQIEQLKEAHKKEQTSLKNDHAKSMDKIKTKLDTSDLSLQQSREDLCKCNALLDDQKKICSEKDAQLDEKESQLIERTQLIEQLKSQLDTLHGELLEARAQSEMEKGAMRQERIAESSQHEQQLQDISRQLELAQQSVEEKTTTTQKLAEQLSNVQRQEKELRESSSEQQAQFAKMQADWLQRKEELRNQLQDRNREVLLANDKLQKQLDQVDRLQKDVEERNETVQDLEANIKSQQTEIEQLQSTVQQKESELDEAKNQISQLQSSGELDQSALRDLQEQAQQLEHQLSETKIQLESALKTVDDLTGKLKVTKSELGQCRDTLEQAEQKRDQLQENLNEVTKKLQEKEMQLSEAQLAVKDEQMKVSGARQELEDAEERHRQETASAQILSSASLGKQSQLIDQMQEKLMKTQSDLREALADQVALQQELEREVGKSRAAEEQHKLGLAQVTQEAEQRVASEVEARKVQLAELRDTLIKERDRQLAEEADRIKELETQAKCLDTELAQMLNEKNANEEESKNQIKQLQQNLRDGEEKRAELLTKLDELQQQKQQAERDFETQLQTLKQDHYSSVQQMTSEHGSAISLIKQQLQTQVDELERKAKDAARQAENDLQQKELHISALLSGQKQREAEYHDTLEAEKQAMLKKQFEKQAAYLNQIDQALDETRTCKVKAHKFEQQVDAVSTACKAKMALLPSQVNTKMSSKKVADVVTRLERVDKEMAELQKEDSDDSHVLNDQVTALLKALAVFAEQEISTRLNEESKMQQQKMAKENQLSLKKLDEKHAAVVQEIQQERDGLAKQVSQLKPKAAQATKKSEELNQAKLEIAVLKEKATLNNSVSQKEIEKLREKSRLLQDLHDEANSRAEAVRKELESYRVYLPETEQLLKDLNSRHAKTQEMLQREQDERSQAHSEIEQVRADLNSKIEQIKQLESELDEVNGDCEVLANQLRETEQQMQESSEAHEREMQSMKEKLASQEDLCEKLSGDMRNQQVELRDAFEKLDEQGALLEEREGELRDLVCALKEFKLDKEELETQNKSLQRELELLAPGTNSNYRIQLHLRLKEENNQLRKQLALLQKQLPKDSANMVQKMQSNQSRVERQAEKLQRQLRTLVAHTLSLIHIDQVAKEYGMRMDNILQDNDSVLEPEHMQALLDLISAIDARLAGQPNQLLQADHKKLQNVGGNSVLATRNYLGQKSSLLTRLEQSESQTGGIPELPHGVNSGVRNQRRSSYFNAVSEEDNEDSFIHYAEKLKKKRNVFETNEVTSDDADGYRGRENNYRKDQTVVCLPEDIKRVQLQQEVVVTADVEAVSPLTDDLEAPGRAFISVNDYGDDEKLAYGTQPKLKGCVTDRSNLSKERQNKDLLRAAVSKKHAEKILAGRSGSGAGLGSEGRKLGARRQSAGDVDSPVVMNSYSSIYRQQQQSRQAAQHAISSGNLSARDRDGSRNRDSNRKQEMTARYSHSSGQKDFNQVSNMTIGTRFNEINSMKQYTPVAAAGALTQPSQQSSVFHEHRKSNALLATKVVSERPQGEAQRPSSLLAAALKKKNTLASKNNESNRTIPMSKKPSQPISIPQVSIAAVYANNKKVKLNRNSSAAHITLNIPQSTRVASSSRPLEQKQVSRKQMTHNTSGSTIGNQSQRYK